MDPTTVTVAISPIVPIFFTPEDSWIDVAQAIAAVLSAPATALISWMIFKLQTKHELEKMKRAKHEAAARIRSAAAGCTRSFDDLRQIFGNPVDPRFDRVRAANITLRKAKRWHDKLQKLEADTPDEMSTVFLVNALDTVEASLQQLSNPEIFVPDAPDWRNLLNLAVDPLDSIERLQRALAKYFLRESEETKPAFWRHYLRPKTLSTWLRATLQKLKTVRGKGTSERT